MFIPVHDKNELQFIRFQIVTISLIALNIAVYVWQMSLSQTEANELAMGAGFIPSAFMGSAVLPDHLAMMPAEVTLVTYMFLHGSLLHIVSNMVFLWVFGDNVEDAIGYIKFLAFYLICGVAAALTHGIMEPGSKLPMIGASGATSGIIGAYLLLYPRAKVWAIVLLRFPIRIPSYLLLSFWAGFQAYFVFSGSQPETAWWAHIGGFLAGAILILFMRRKGVRLFGPHGAPNPTSEAETA